MRVLPRMTSPDSPHKATRRRVRVFIGICLLVVLLVGFCPVKGFRVAGRSKVAVSLGSAQIVDFVTYQNRNGSESIACLRSLKSFDSYSQAQAEFAMECSTLGAVHGYRERPIVSDRAHTFLADTNEAGEAILVFRYRNVQGSLDVTSVRSPDSSESFACECLDIVLNALDRGNSGATAEYMPPALQLWKSKAAPFFKKKVAPFLKKHFP